MLSRLLPCDVLVKYSAFQPPIAQKISCIQTNNEFSQIKKFGVKRSYQGL